MLLTRNKNTTIDNKTTKKLLKYSIDNIYDTLT